MAEYKLKLKLEHYKENHDGYCSDPSNFEEEIVYIDPCELDPPLQSTDYDNSGYLSDNHHPGIISFLRHNGYCGAEYNVSWVKIVCNVIDTGRFSSWLTETLEKKKVAAEKEVETKIKAEEEQRLCKIERQAEIERKNTRINIEIKKRIIRNIKILQECSRCNTTFYNGKILEYCPKCWNRYKK